MHNFFVYPSSYLVIIAWAASGFMAQPTFASFMVHFVIAPILLVAANYMAHWEGRREVRQDRSAQ